MFDAHTDTEFKTRDIKTSMATMGASPHVTHVPTMTGGHGRDEVRRFYETWFIGHWPEDTVGETQLVDEVIITFTHDCEMPALLPGVPPTGRKVVIPFVVVVGFEGSKIAYERIYWDQASLLVQLGLLDKETLPGTGAEDGSTDNADCDGSLLEDTAAPDPGSPIFEIIIMLGRNPGDTSQYPPNCHTAFELVC